MRPIPVPARPVAARPPAPPRPPPARLAAVLAVLLVPALGCVRNPATGKRQLSLVSPAQEVELGQEARQQVVSQVGLYEDPALNQYVEGVGRKLAAVSERPELPWSFQVVDDAAVNAFALPGGPIFATRGILAYMDSEAELAAVLGHEVGHVTARHTATQLTRAQLSQLGLGLGAVLLGGQAGAALAQLGGAGLQLMLLRYSRDAERQADELGLRYVQAAHYQPAAMAELFHMLERTAGAEPGRLPSWLATHPAPEERLKRTEERLAKLPSAQQGEVNRDAYLQRLDGLAYGLDPRQGFFRGQTFLHPGLRFQVTFPEGFRTRNQPQAVVALGPRQDVALLLAPAPGNDPEAAAAAFAQQEGVQVAGAARGTLNGLPAVTARFLAQSEQGPLEGAVAFVLHAGRVFQLLGYSPAGAFAAHAPEVERTFASFGPLTDPQVLAMQPARLRVVQLPRTMTLAEFAKASPSSVPLEELARLNGVEPNAILEAGRKVKRVEGQVLPPESQGTGAG